MKLNEDYNDTKKKSHFAKLFSENLFSVSSKSSGSISDDMFYSNE